MSFLIVFFAEPLPDTYLTTATSNDSMANLVKNIRNSHIPIQLDMNMQFIKTLQDRVTVEKLIPCTFVVLSEGP